MKLRNALLSSAICLWLIIAVAPLPGQQNSFSDPLFEEQIQKGRDALSQRRFKDAIDAFKKANKLQKNMCADCFLGLAVAFLHEGDLSQVLENADKAISLADADSKRAVAHHLKGNALMTIGEPGPKSFQQAEAEYREAVRLDPGSPQLRLNLAKALLKQSKDDDAIAELKKCLELSPGDAVAQEAKLLTAEPERGRKAFAADFQVTTMQGQEISLKGLSGKVVILDFWATWCPPCRASVGELKNLTRKYPSDRLQLISISADSNEVAWRDFVAQKRMDWPQFRDSDGKMRELFAVRVFPTYILIDGDGVLRQRITGKNPQESVVYRLKEQLGALPALSAAR